MGMVTTERSGYRSVRQARLAWLPGTFHELVHEPTGARHIHIEHPDENVACNIVIRTHPTNSTGVPHILEHSVLNGSRLYDVRSVFFEMTKRSLATFMNAMTRDDSTQYPFATRSRDDFQNLLKVYLDAVFFPTLSEDTFLQEGWRYEFENKDDPASQLLYKGVVFNEMKATMAGDGFIMWMAVGAGLFPGTPYATNFGGDAEVMPDLTWQGLRDFHARHYHPANAIFVTAGGIPVDEILPAIAEQCLAEFSKRDPIGPVPDVEPFAAPRRLEVPKAAPPVDPDRAGQTLVAWATRRLAGDADTAATFALLNQVLLGHNAAPLRKRLVDSGLGTAPADLSGYTGIHRQATFSAGLKGCAPADADRIEDLVLTSLEEIARQGIDRSTIEGALDRFEFSVRERDGNYSLGLTMRPVRAALDGLDTLAALDLEPTVERLRARAQEPGFLEAVIRDDLLANNHRCTVVLIPDADLNDRRRRAELSKLSDIQGTLPEEQRASIVEVAGRLAARQSAKTDVSSLPDLPLTEVPLRFEEPEFEEVDAAGSSLYVFPLPTSGVSYLHLAADFSDLPPDLKGLLPVLARALPRLPAGGRSADANSERIARETGGISAAARVQPMVDGREHFEWFVIQGKALDRRQDALVELAGDLLQSLVIDPSIVAKVVREMHQQAEASLAASGLLFAVTLASGRLDAVGALGDRLNGHGQLLTLRRLSDPAALDGLLADLARVRDHIFARGRFRVAVTATEKDASGLADAMKSRLTGLPEARSAGTGGAIPLLAGRSEARTTNTAIAFNVAGFRTVPYTHPDAPALSVLGPYVGQTVLLNEIREKGGAYTTGAQSNPLAQHFIFLSGSDPNVERTYDVFAQAVRHVLEDEFDPQELKQAILTTCRQLDPLESPDDRAQRTWIDAAIGRTLAMRRAHKESVLRVQPDDLRRVAAAYFGGEPIRVTVGGSGVIDKARSARPDLFESVAPA